ncbi:DNA polymerase III [Candidatus Woesearchaeota archaeon]|nr:DNA polymerase III [Candidatus Woesearchaeota archaeon]|tara:strand:+ start:17996 stop:19720 length:1725 start_codon:yes stop_codon:yes gene_type:complete
MKNSEVADILYGIADMLEMQNIQFKPNAYRKAARSVEESSHDVNEIYQSKGKAGLKDKFSGVGNAISEKIEEFLTTGKLRYYEELKKKFPKHISELMEISSLGPKRIKLLHEKLKISNVKQLEAAARKHKIAKLATLGKKTEEEILKGIEMFKRGQERMFLGHALPIALEIENKIKKFKDVEASSICGSIRRRKETIGDIDILASSAKPDKVMSFFTKLPGVKRVLAKGSTKASVLLKNDLQIDLRVVESSSYGAALQYFTGSKEHNIAVRELAIRKKLKINEYGVYKGKKKIAGKTEKEVYKKLGMDYVEPELRENRGEIEASLKRKLPNIVSCNNIKGDFHAHTKFSDGSDSIEEMVAAAKKLGYEYIAITDHSKSLRVAHGLSEQKMLEHIKKIKVIDKKTKGIKVLAGSEIEILPNGELDYSDSLLKKFDIVVGAVHSRFKSSKEEMTSRILTALENPYIDILAHPTGRRIGKREPYEVDLKKVFEKAAKNKVYLEINSHPERTDLNDINAFEAKKHGCKFVIDTDAHSTSGLDYINLGVAIARRAWLTQKDIVNTSSAKQLSKLFKRIK